MCGMIGVMNFHFSLVLVVVFMEQEVNLFSFLMRRTLEEINEPPFLRRGRLWDGGTVMHGDSLCFSVLFCLHGSKTYEMVDCGFNSLLIAGPPCNSVQLLRK